MEDRGRRGRSASQAPALRALGLVGLGAILASAIMGVAFWFGGDALLYRALGGEGLARACTPPLVATLKDRGFEPADIEFGPDPKLGSPFARPRSFGASFTFRDGAAQVRVDGVMACAVSGEEATVEVRVATVPRRAA